MNIFDVNKYPTNTNLPANNNTNQNQQPGESNGIPFEELVGVYLKGTNGTNRDGLLLNNSDTELISNQLEQYLPTDSLRLEIQIQRLTNELETTQKEIKALALLPNSELKTNQQKVLLQKIQSVVKNLDRLKDEYREIGPMHYFALWLKDQMKSTKGLGDKIKSIFYGKQANFINELKQANTSMELLTGQLQTSMNNSNPDNKTNITDIIKQYEKIDNNIEKLKQDYYGTQREPLTKSAVKKFQQYYYGYEIPEENYKLTGFKANKEEDNKKHNYKGLQTFDQSEYRFKG